MQEVTLDEFKSYANIDYNDDDTIIQNLIDETRIYIDSMVGEDYKKDEKLIKLSNFLLKKLVYTEYDNKGSEVNNNTKTDRYTNSILDKLALGVSDND